MLLNDINMNNISHQYTYEQLYEKGTPKQMDIEIFLDRFLPHRVLNLIYNSMI
jgi:hypothetical protein